MTGHISWNRKPFEDLINDYKLISNNKFDYSLSTEEDYLTNKTIKIICKKHGEFIQKTYCKLRCEGCEKENLLEKNKLKFIEKCNNLHNNKFDYSKINYVNNTTKLLIICPVHGEFMMEPKYHKQGLGCFECNKEHGSILKQQPKNSIEYYLDIFEKVHEGKYQYNNLKYTGRNSDKINITCPIHGDFLQSIDNHKAGHGCKECKAENISNRFKYSLDDFIQKSSKVHNNYYDYSKVNYINSKTNVTIICPEHGEFKQKAGGHLLGKGCKKCTNNVSKLEKNYREFLISNNLKIETNVQFDWLKKTENSIKNMELDIFIPELNLAIEINGVNIHASTPNKFNKTGVDKNYHQLKYDLCKENGIKLIHIFQFESMRKWKHVLKNLINNIEQYEIDFTNEKRIHNDLEYYGKTIINKL